MKNSKTPAIEFEDIQGFVLRGYGRLSQASYVFYRIIDVTAFQRWLLLHLPEQSQQSQNTREEVHQHTFSKASLRIKEGGCREAIAFTASGLQKILGAYWAEHSFPLAFVEGMVTAHRSRLLGDVAENAPTQWRWGHHDGIDLVLMVFAENQAFIDEATASTSSKDGLELVHQVSAFIPADGKEPFGFADGISQPFIAGTDRAKDAQAISPRNASLHILAAGEFVLGYPDGSSTLPRTPALSPAGDPLGLLPPHWQQPELRDFGRNGTFVVMRQLAQDVAGFASFVKEYPDPAVDIAEKMLGRRRDGTPLTFDKQAKTDNDFDFLQDLDGKGCPIGAHIRRSNPRSTVHATSHEVALTASNRHRIIRRGRVYKTSEGETGLMFVAINASINRQFEFIQSTWCNDPNFQGLAGEVDPIIGTQLDDRNAFTIPAEPVRSKVRNLQQWVSVKGGAYFFMPGIRALKVLGHIPVNT